MVDDVLVERVLRAVEQVVREAVEALGHARRQMYLDASVADVYAETGDRSLYEALVKRSQSPLAAFAAVRGNGEYRAWVLEGAARPVWMRNLGCLETVRALGLGLAEAAEGKAGAGGRRLGPTEAWQVEDWMDHLAEQHEKAEALDLLP